MTPDEPLIAPRCPWCGYSTRGLDRATCPECGGNCTAPAAAVVARRERPLQKLIRVNAIIACAGVPLVWLVTPPPWGLVQSACAAAAIALWLWTWNSTAALSRAGLPRRIVLVALSFILSGPFGVWLAVLGVVLFPLTIVVIALVVRDRRDSRAGLPRANRRLRMYP